MSGLELLSTTGRVPMLRPQAVALRGRPVVYTKPCQAVLRARSRQTARPGPAASHPQMGPARFQCSAGLRAAAPLRRAHLGGLRSAVACHPAEIRCRAKSVWQESDPSTEFEKLQFDEKEQTVLLIACLTGILTGGGILLFSSLIHSIQDLIWDGQLRTGFTLYLRQSRLEEIWPQLVLAPCAAGALVSVLRAAVGGFDPPPATASKGSTSTDSSGRWQQVLRPPAKTVAAALTLGSGASLGPEGPSVEIGSSVGRALSGLVKRKRHRGMLLAAGSAAGISAGFGAPIAGVFFAVETVLSKDSSSMKGKESGVAVASLLLASVCANTVAHTDYGVAPLFAVPQYSVQPGELPLYWLLGAMCGLLCTAFAYSSEVSANGIRSLKEAGVPAPLLPVLGGLVCGLVSLAYPEIRYQAFDNVDAILQSGFHGAQVYAPALLFQIVVAKVVLTSVCRSSGLVGGLYGPSIFLGAAMGILYGSIVTEDLAWLVQMSPQQAYGLVAVGAVIAGNCRVPLTAILLLFELTHDYIILLPTLGAVGLSYWVSVALDPSNSRPAKEEPASPPGQQQQLLLDTSAQRTMASVDLDVLLVGDYMQQVEMIRQTASPMAAVSAISDAQPPCVLVVDEAGGLAGCVTVETLRAAVCVNEVTAPKEQLLQQEDHGKGPAVDDTTMRKEAAGLSGSLTCSISPFSSTSLLDLCARDENGSLLQCDDEDSLASALRIMENKGVRYLPVVSKYDRRAVGVLDRDVIVTQVQLLVIQAEVERMTVLAPKINSTVTTET